MDQIEVYTDGGAYNGQKGACAFIILKQGKIIYKKGYKKENTTNNRMEMSAVITALMYIEENLYPCNVFINSDSQYVVKGITEWIPNWKKKGWKNSKKKDVENKDLWIMLDNLTNRIKNIRWQWVRGHNGNKYNEIVDQMCTKILRSNG
jgi:ribonuclease HI